MLVSEEATDPRRITVIPNGIDLQKFDARARQGLLAPLPEADGPVVLHVANMNHVVKRQEDVIGALAILKARGVKLHAFFVGDGPRRKLLEDKARTAGVSDRAHFLGHRKDVPALWTRADLGVLCSTAEGTSNAIMEGMAAARPMVVTGVGGSPDLIADGERGRVVRPERPLELAEAFAALLADADNARRIGRAARAFLARELTLERLVERHDALYRRVLGWGRRDEDGPRDRAPLARGGAAVSLGDDARV
jgi:glycosyltransferase involved in cell wall biosynthesis